MTQIFILPAKLPHHKDHGNVGIQANGAQGVDAVVQALVLHHQQGALAANGQPGGHRDGLVFVAARYQPNAGNALFKSVMQGQLNPVGYRDDMVNKVALQGL
jgi:hypothetical protein